MGRNMDRERLHSLQTKAITMDNGSQAFIMGGEQGIMQMAANIRGIGRIACAMVMVFLLQRQGKFREELGSIIPLFNELFVSVL